MERSSMAELPRDQEHSTGGHCQAVQRRWPVAVAAGVLVAGAGVVAVRPWKRQA